MFNLGCILGVAALIRPLSVKPSVAWGASPALFALSVVSGLLVADAEGFSRGDGVLLLAFLLGLPANELVLPVALTAYLGTQTLAEQGSLTALHSILTANGWTNLTAVCFLIFTLFHAPCATTLLTVYKETGSRRVTFAAFLLPTLTGIVLCALIAFFARI